MGEYQIILDCEAEVPESMLNLIVDVIKDEVVKKHGFEKYISDVYWDEV